MAGSSTIEPNSCCQFYSLTCYPQAHNDQSDAGTHSFNVYRVIVALCPKRPVTISITSMTPATMLKGAFRPRARLLVLLGDQLIRDPGIAVFELIKNAYDADAGKATVTMESISDPKSARIIVQDNGTGMDVETVTGVWLEPGTDFRAQQRRSKSRTTKYRRLPLGEKGVGRFAAHKLGRKVTLITRARARSEVVVEIDWHKILRYKYLKDVPVRVHERAPEVFTGRKTGTRIEISDLRNSWSRGMVRELARSVNSISSPFVGKGDFQTEFNLAENSAWLKGLLTVQSVLESALFTASCDIKNGKLTYAYKFTPLPGMDKVQGRKSRLSGPNAIPLKLDAKQDAAVRDVALLKKHVGPIHIDLYIFDRDPQILELGVTDRKGLREFLDESGGVRVYRDDIRVYDYGEPGNDWLELGGRRINVPTQRISNNIVLGAVSIGLNKSSPPNPDSGVGLIEKTNREGFVDNPTFRAFRDAVLFGITQIEAERNIDKKRIRRAYASKREREPVQADLGELRDLVEKKKLTKEIGPYLNRIEADFTAIRDRFLLSASTGLSLSVVIHEVEKGIAELQRAVVVERTGSKIKGLAKHLAELVEGYGALVRRSGISRERASALITQALFNVELRLQAHGVSVLVDTSHDFSMPCSRRLTISTIMNLVDNSIWWLDNKWGESGNSKKLYVGTSREFARGPAIVVADNGPGFIDPPEYLVEPFLSRKPDGMGLGLHLADQVMKSQGGQLIFPEMATLKLPKGYDGAVVALVFGGSKQ